MSMNKWFKTKLASMALAFVNVEKNALGQSNNSLSDSIGKHRSITQGTLMDNLLCGELTQEVKNLRWRMYKTMKAVDNMSIDVANKIDTGEEFSENSIEIASIKSLDKDVDMSNVPQYKLKPKDYSKILKKIKIDDIDDIDTYDLEIVVFNNEKTVGLSETFEQIKNFGSNEEIIIVDGEKKLKVDINNISLDSSVKTDKTIKVSRDFIPKFYIENYTKKLNIRKITDDEKLLEFYVSKFPSEYTNSANFISEIKRLIERGPRNFNFLEIDGVGFSSNDTIGVEKYRYYEYEITKYDKIIEFDGYYVIKFFANVVTNGADILEAFVEQELEEKYNKKEAITNDYRYS